MELITSLRKYLTIAVPDLVIKSYKQSEENETVESRKSADMYIAAKLGMDSFSTYVRFSESSLIKAGITDTNMIKLCIEDKFNIPSNYRDKVVEMEGKKIISEYVETNEYYRMIAGLPRLGEDYIFLDTEDLSTYGIYEEETEDFEKRTPLHELPGDVLTAMETNGYLAKLQELYPDQKYISYLASRKIDIVTARMASPFEILYFPRLMGATRFYRDFLFYYDEAREYFMTVIYNYDFAKQYQYYEGFVGFMILFMATQRMINSLFKVMVDRDFYDLETVRMFLESYEVPFVDLFTLNQQKTFVKNLNILLREKHTTQVFYDILDIMGYDNIEMTKYMLVKQHKTFQKDDESPLKPIFVYRTMIDENGESYITLDKNSMYDYYFYGVDMKESDIHIGTINSANSYNYEEFTEFDPTWVKDDELFLALEESEKNYVETKYCNIAITFKMYQMIFELVYLSRMILDKKSETTDIYIDIPLITSDPTSLFDIEVLLICLMCKRNNVEPDILKSPSKVLSVLGFNFKADLDAIKKDVESNPGLYDQRLVRYLKNIIIVSVDDVNNLYKNVKNLSDFLINAMQTTSSIDSYHAYKKLYQTLMITDLENSIFKKQDGTMPDQFQEWLEEENPDLYQFLDKITMDECADIINYITTKLSTLLMDTKYLSYLNPMDTYVVDGILKILRFFKSYTIDIRDIDVVYLFDSRYHNMMRIIDQTYKTSVEIHKNEIAYPVMDWLNDIKGTIQWNEMMMKLRDAMNLHAGISCSDKMNNRDTYTEEVHLNPKDRSSNFYGDYVDNYNSTFFAKEKLKISDDNVKFIWEE